MASDAKKTKTDPAPKKDAATTAAPAKAAEAAPAKAAEAIPAKAPDAAPAKAPDAAPAKAPDAAPAKAKGGETAAAKPASYSRGEGQKPVTQAYKDNWNAIFATKKTVAKKTKKKTLAKKKTRARNS